MTVAQPGEVEDELRHFASSVAQVKAAITRIQLIH